MCGGGHFEKISFKVYDRSNLQYDVESWFITQSGIICHDIPSRHLFKRTASNDNVIQLGFVKGAMRSRMSFNRSFITGTIRSYENKHSVFIKWAVRTSYAIQQRFIKGQYSVWYHPIMFYDMGTARYGVIQLELIKEAVWIAMSSSKGFTDNSLVCYHPIRILKGLFFAVLYYPLLTLLACIGGGDSSVVRAPDS